MFDLKAAAKRLAERLGATVVSNEGRYISDGLITVHNHSFLKDPRFQRAYERGVKASNGIDPQHHWRVYVLLWAARQTAKIPGDFAECGVNAGFMSSALLTDLDWESLDKSFYLIDTYAGPPPDQYTGDEVAAGRLTGRNEAAERGSYITDVDAVRANFAEWQRVEIVQGRVPEVLDSMTSPRYAFVHIDMNAAAPEVAALNYFWPKLSAGGLILFDDYGYWGYDAQKAALGDAATKLGADILALPTGQGLVLRSG